MCHIDHLAFGGALTKRLSYAWCAGRQVVEIRGERMSSSSSASSSYESSSEEDEEEQEVEELTLEPIKEGTFVSANLKKGLGGGGKIEILREKGVSRYNSKVPFYIKFIDFHVINKQHCDLYVFLTHNKRGARKRMKYVDERDTILYLENGNGGRVKGPGVKGTFQQIIRGVQNIYALTGIAIVKPSTTRPVSTDPEVHVFAKLNDIGDRSPALWYPVLHLRRTAMEDMFYERDQLMKEQKKKEKIGDFTSEAEKSMQLIDKHAKKVFKKYDADKSGAVDIGEFLSMLRKLKLLMLPARARTIFQFCDMEQDGTLDIDQFQVALHVIMELDKYDKKNGRDGTQPLLQLLPHEAFDMMDADNDGLLDKLEFNEALRALNVVPKFSNQLDGEAYLKKLWIKVLKETLPPGEPMPSYCKIRHFERAWIQLCDVEAELKARNIKVPRQSLFAHFKNDTGQISVFKAAKSNSEEDKSEKKKREKKWKELARETLLKHISSEEKREREVMTKARSEAWERKRQDRIAIERKKQALKKQAEKETQEVRLQQANTEKADRAADKARRLQAAKADKLVAKLERESKKLKKKRQKIENNEKRMALNRRLQDAENAVIKNSWDRIDYSKRRLKELPDEIYWYKQKKEKGMEAKKLAAVRILNLRDNHLGELPSRGLFFHMDDLQKVDISFNKIAELPKEIGGCKKIQIFLANNNHLGDIKIDSPLQNYVDLQILELNSNRIKKVHKDVICKWISLKTLLMANNAIEIM